MIGFVQMLAGVGWDPYIRGLLTVALGLAVLGGSVWLLLVTNTGTRLGSLIALAGFWGWMFVMGIFWWIYGIGWAGSLPTWEIEDVFIDEAGAIDGTAGLQEAFVGNVEDLPDGNCFNDREIFPPAGGVGSVSLDPSASTWALCTPRAIEVLMAYPGTDREAVLQELLNAQSDDAKIPAIAIEAFDGVESPESEVINDKAARTCSGSAVRLGDDDKVCVNGVGMTNQQLLASRSDSEREMIFGELLSRREIEIADAAAAGNDRLGPDDPRYLDAAGLDAKIVEDVGNAWLRIDDISLSQLESLAPHVNEWAEDAGLIRLDGWNLQSSAQSGEAAATVDAFLREELFPEGNFLVLDAYQQGGKPVREDDDMWSRFTHKVTSTVRITHPTNYTVVNVQQVLEKEADPSKPPPVPEIDPAEPTYSVVLIRNLGNLRLIPALFTIVSLLFFVAVCLVLHWRDLAMQDKGLDV